MSQVSDDQLHWHILTLKATKESARSIWQNQQLAFYEELLRLRSAPSPLDEGMRQKCPNCKGPASNDTHNLHMCNTCNGTGYIKSAHLSPQEPAAGESDANGVLVPEFSCDDDGSLTVEWYRSNTSVLSVSSDDSAEFHFAAATGPGITSSGCWQLGQDPPQSFYDAYRAVVAPVDAALLAAQKDGQDARRYRWLREVEGQKFTREFQPPRDHRGYRLSYDDLDAAIDSQLAGKGDL